MDMEGPIIEVDEESYEVKAIRAYLRGELKARDLQASLEVSRPTMYRMISRYRESGPAGLVSKKAGNRNRAYPDEYRQRVLAIVRENYADFGPKLAREKLEKLHGISVSDETLREWMIADTLWKDRQRRQPRTFSPRQPRDQRGELIQVDGSYHRWFEKRGPECCLLVFIDDATSELMLLRFVDHETSYNYMNCLKSYIERFGKPLALFSDRHSIFRVTRPDGNGDRRPTQFARACGALRIRIICAKTPQAKGRVERANRTLQDRLIKEMRLRNISTMEEGNFFLEEYRVDHNKRFAREPLDPLDAHLPKPNEGLNKLLTYTVQRKVFKDLSLSFNKTRIVLEENDLSRKAVGKQVTVALPLEGELEVLFDETPLPYRVFDKIRRIDDDVPPIVDHKRLGAALALGKAICEVEPHHFQRNGHVLAGFRKHFSDPEDPTSSALRNAPEDIRRRNRRRSRAPLGPHPIVILESRVVDLQKTIETRDCVAGEWLRVWSPFRKTDS
jgi:transposase